jgi:hypothetical protein
MGYLQITRHEFHRGSAVNLEAVAFSTQKAFSQSSKKSVDDHLEQFAVLTKNLSIRCSGTTALHRLAKDYSATYTPHVHSPTLTTHHNPHTHAPIPHPAQHPCVPQVSRQHYT